MAQVSVALLVHFPSNWQGYFSHPLGVSIRHTLLPLTGNLGMSPRTNTSFHPELLPLPRVLGSFPFSRLAVLQGACPSTSCRESIASEGSECLIQWAQKWVWRHVWGTCLGTALFPIYSWRVLSECLLLRRTSCTLFTTQVKLCQNWCVIPWLPAPAKGHASVWVWGL